VSRAIFYGLFERKQALYHTVIAFIALSMHNPGYNAVLRSVSFWSTSDSPTSGGATTRTITWQVTDNNAHNAANGPLAATAVTSTINLVPLPDVPVVAGLGTANFTENGAAVALAGGLTVTDPDDSQLIGAVVSISANFRSGDTLHFTDQSGITGSYDGATGLLTLTGTATLANYQTALRSITFSSTSDDPTDNASATTRTLSWQVTDANSDAAGAATSVLATSTLNLTPLPDAPVITPTGALTYTENVGATIVDSTITVTDVDDTLITGGSIRITSNFLAGDVLAVTDSGSITSSYDPGTGFLTLSGTDTKAHYQTVLRSLSYLNSTDDPTDNTTKTTRTLTYSLADANSDLAGTATGTASKTINLTPLPDAPLITGGGQTLAYTEQAAAAVIDATVVVSADADDTQMAGATVRLSAGFTTGDILAFTDHSGITGSYNALTGVLTLSGNATLANYTAALQSVRFHSTSDDPTAISTSRTVTWQVTDANSDAAGAATSNTVTSTITLTPVNDAPTLTGTATASYTENGAAIPLFSGITVTDVDDTDIVSASVSIDALGFLSGDTLHFTDQSGITGSYDGATGLLTLTGTATLANYQAALRSITFSSTSDDPHR
jgi:hypothetical protein